MEKFTITYEVKDDESTGRFRSIIVKADSEEKAKEKLLAKRPEVEIIGVHATEDVDVRKGMPELKEAVDNKELLAHQQKVAVAKTTEEEQEPVYADASRNFEKTAKVKAEVVKMEKAPEHEEKGKMPKMVPEAKKMHLDESLFESALDDYYDSKFDYEDSDEEHEEGICPECGTPVEYSNDNDHLVVADTEAAYYSCKCPSCGNHWKEWHEIQLNFSHYEKADSPLKEDAGRRSQIDYVSLAKVKHYIRKESMNGENAIDMLVDWADAVGKLRELGDLIDSLAERVEEFLTRGNSGIKEGFDEDGNLDDDTDAALIELAYHDAQDGVDPEDLENTWDEAGFKETLEDWDITYTDEQEYEWIRSSYLHYLENAKEDLDSRYGYEDEDEEDEDLEESVNNSKLSNKNFINRG